MPHVDFFFLPFLSELFCMSPVQNVFGGRRREATGVLTRKGISSLPQISNSKQGVKRHGHVNKLKTDTMRPQFLGLD